MELIALLVLLVPLSLLLVVHALAFLSTNKDLLVLLDLFAILEPALHSTPNLMDKAVSKVKNVFLVMFALTLFALLQLQLRPALTVLNALETTDTLENVLATQLTRRTNALQQLNKISYPHALLKLPLLKTALNPRAVTPDLLESTAATMKFNALKPVNSPPLVLFHSFALTMSHVLLPLTVMLLPSKLASYWPLLPYWLLSSKY